MFWICVLIRSAIRTIVPPRGTGANAATTHESSSSATVNRVVRLNRPVPSVMTAARCRVPNQMLRLRGEWLSRGIGVQYQTVGIRCIERNMKVIGTCDQLGVDAQHSEPRGVYPHDVIRWR